MKINDFLTKSEMGIIKSLPKYDSKKSNKGYVYMCTNSVLWKHNIMTFKVGCTNNLYKRLIEDPQKNENDASIPGYYIPLVALKCDMYKNIENAIHKKIGKENKEDGRSKEWFNVSPESIIDIFLEFSKYATGNEIISLTNNKNIQNYITCLLNKSYNNIESQQEFIVDSHNRIVNKPIDYKKHVNFKFEDIGLKVGDRFRHKIFRQVVFSVQPNDKIKYEFGLDEDIFEDRPYTLSGADDILHGYDEFSCKGRSGQKSYMTMDGIPFTYLWNRKRTELSHYQNEGDIEKLF